MYVNPLKKIQVTDEVALCDITMGVNALREGIEDTVFDYYRDRGGFSFDTARMYFDGECDRKLGRYLAARGIRHEITLCAKGCYPADSSKMYLSRLSPKEIRYDLEESLRLLGTDYADLYLLHRDDVKIPVEQIMPTLDALVREGKTRVIGVSNWTVGRIAKANKFAKENGLAPLSICQLHFSLARTTAMMTGDITHVPMSDVEYDWFLENDFPIMAFSSQAKGFFAAYEKGEKMEKLSLRNYYLPLEDNLRRAERACELGRKYGVSASAIAVAYLRAKPLRVSALCSYSKLGQIEDSFGFLNIALTEDEVHYLERG